MYRYEYTYSCIHIYMSIHIPTKYNNSLERLKTVFNANGITYTIIYKLCGFHGLETINSNFKNIALFLNPTD